MIAAYGYSALPPISATTKDENTRKEGWLIIMTTSLDSYDRNPINYPDVGKYVFSFLGITLDQVLVYQHFASCQSNNAHMDDKL